MRYLIEQNCIKNIKYLTEEYNKFKNKNWNTKWVYEIYFSICQQDLGDFYHYPHLKRLIDEILFEIQYDLEDLGLELSNDLVPLKKHLQSEYHIRLKRYNSNKELIKNKYNANQLCDVYNGPCSCGAWH